MTRFRFNKRIGLPFTYDPPFFVIGWGNCGTTTYLSIHKGTERGVEYFKESCL